MFMLRSTVPSVRHLILNKTFFTFLKNCGKFITLLVSSNFTESSPSDQYIEMEDTKAEKVDPFQRQVGST
jgi:hypothetical protein